MALQTTVRSICLWAVLTLCMLASIHGVFLDAPRERVMGDVQRIFYFHFPAALGSFLAFAVVCFAGVSYLCTRQRRWDHLGRASAEVGVLFCTIVLVSGPLWAKSAWGTWWTWEARLTTMLVLWLLYISYLMIGLYTDSREQRARAAAVVGIVAFLDVPIVYFSVKWWRGHHPIILGRGGEGGLSPEMWPVVWICLVTFLLLYGILVGLRMSLARAEDIVLDMEEHLQN
ncbi:MAG: cytochrome c biogenesis protein CcsA [Acidobacteria bacterium]|nr:cytochrome c biogenesis protein CcsA [Acidobacteriota bacterium]